MISIQNLSFSYRKNKPLFENLNLQLEAGHIYGLLGKNGAGKSSLLKHIAGLLFPNAGHCKVLGFESRYRQPAFLQNIFMVPEEFYLPQVSIKSYVSTYAPFYPLFDKKAFYNYLEEFQIPMDQKLTEMSYGQKKKVLISFALASNTKALILDEPTNGLDIPSKSQFRKVIAAAVSDEKCIMISTHQVRDLDNLIDSIVIIDNHKIIFRQDVETVTDRLLFSTVTNIADTNKVLFSDSSIRGHAVITPNEGAQHSKIDMELLFNAVLDKPERITQIFN
ncbi:ABC-2 type transport system ATP-binding protein [Chitinophaga sp. YR627]|uniref:ABC transporter ATP-binding protein n=1 Tax=Chitinophaga sp. YR627 TaxID=1881041 RepID=UPI0008E1D3A1|nr:ABC transporter ATP-binding protein [Chitinophaga sp. YR627]SFO25303.1 ABC-2 type transport system ATP-binding protein [Chitinophaga sp. YR627]